MEVDEDQWKPRDKLLLVEAVTSGAAGGGSNGNRGDSGGQEGKRDVNWAAVSRLLRKHIPKKRLTTPTSFGSKVPLPFVLSFFIVFLIITYF